MELTDADHALPPKVDSKEWCQLQVSQKKVLIKKKWEVFEGKKKIKWPRLWFDVEKLNSSQDLQ